MRKILPLALAACSAAVHPAARGPARSPAGITDAGWDRVHAIATHGTIDVGGMHGTIEGIDDVSTGRHVSTVKLGAIEQSDGFDGTLGWERTPGGEVVAQDAPDAVALARTAAWLTRRGYLHAEGARYEDLGDRSDGGATYHVVRATPDGGAPVELWIDGRGRLARTRDHEGTDTVTTTFSDWRTVGGVELPFRAVSDPGDPRNVATIALDDAHLVDAPGDAAFARPSADADRISFAAGATSTQVPFELINNHIYIHASIDGQPVRVLVDTGGLNALTPAAAKKLGLTAEGAMAASGAGDAKVDVGFAHAKTLTVGDATLARPIFFVIDMGKLADVEGVDADGLIGFEMLERLRVRIDYPARMLTLTAPEAFTPPKGAIAVPFEMSDRTPIVQGTIDGLPGRFWIDTGSRVSLTTMAKFTRDHDLAGKYHPPFDTVTGWGVGGATRSAPVRFHEVTIGGAVVHDVVGDLFTGDKGSFANPDAAGNVGGGILHRFVVTFDYAAKVMYLEPGPNGAIDEREPFDRSGLFLIRDGDALAVAALVPGGPAEKAGVKEGDRVTAIDGAPIATRTLPEWRAQLRDRKPGTRVALRVVHAGGKPTAIEITLAELIP